MYRGKGKKQPITCPERQAFLIQRWGAKKSRGIEFHLTYEQWAQWWEKQLGPDWFNRRGNKSGQYVMARNGDKGPYALWNIKCVTVEDNLKERDLCEGRGNAKLTKTEVATIYLKMKNSPRGTSAQLARQFKVSGNAIKDIRTKITWRHVTDLLD